MSTLSATAQARADQATAGRVAAEQALSAVMQRIEPCTLSVSEAFQRRRWEARVEDPRRHPALATAHGTWRRALRAEAKARAAVHRARFDIRQATGAAGGLVALSAEQVLEGLRERRAA